jgi:hypothetical protein
MYIEDDTKNYFTREDYVPPVLGCLFIHSFIDFRIRAKEALSAMSVIALHLPAFRKR